jgi:hypothetical protein
MFVMPRRFAAILLAVGLVLGLVPQAAAAHCQPTSPTEVGHHDEHGRKDTDRAEQCPHCPPVDCQRHSQCALGLDWSVVEPSLGLVGPPHAAAYLAVATTTPILTLEPPTPPPQSVA